MVLRFSAVSVALAFVFIPDRSGEAHHASEQTEASTVEALFARVADVYAQCQTYRDEGKQTRVLRAEIGGVPREVVSEFMFTTAFARPGRFRFQFTDSKWPNTRYLIWQDGAEVRTYWDLQPWSRTSPTLGEALADAAGVSRSASRLVPALLIPGEVHGSRVTTMRDVVLLDDDEVDGVPFYVVEGRFRTSRVRVWVSKATFLIHKIVNYLESADHSETATTIYRPLIDRNIGENALRFDPDERD